MPLVSLLHKLAKFLYGYSDHAVDLVRNQPRDPVHMVQDLVNTYSMTRSHTPVPGHWTGDTVSELVFTRSAGIAKLRPVHRPGYRFSHHGTCCATWGPSFRHIHVHCDSKYILNNYIQYRSAVQGAIVQGMQNHKCYDDKNKQRQEQGSSRGRRNTTTRG